ncbi:protein of unknown function [Clostridium beijerinckii]|nr:protein of unknown function [Clostridium beijerinckii]
MTVLIAISSVRDILAHSFIFNNYFITIKNNKTNIITIIKTVQISLCHS